VARFRCAHHDIDCHLNRGVQLLIELLSHECKAAIRAAEFRSLRREEVKILIAAKFGRLWEIVGGEVQVKLVADVREQEGKDAMQGRGEADDDEQHPHPGVRAARQALHLQEHRHGIDNLRPAKPNQTKPNRAAHIKHAKAQSSSAWRDAHTIHNWGGNLMHE